MNCRLHNNYVLSNFAQRGFFIFSSQEVLVIQLSHCFHFSLLSLVSSVCGSQSSQTEAIVHIHQHFHSFVQNKRRVTALLLLKSYTLI